MIPANLEQDRLLAAIRFTRQASGLVDGIKRKWLAWEATRPKARELDIQRVEIDHVLAMLTDAKANHWNAAGLLRGIIERIFDMNDPELAGVGLALQAAYDAIADTSHGVAPTAP